MIHGVFVVTDLLVCDEKARTAEQLTRSLAEFNTAASHVWTSRLDAMTTQASRASTEGDLREGLDPYLVSESILNAMLGAQLLRRDSTRQRPHQTTHPIPGTPAPSNRHRHLTGLLPRVSSPRIPPPSHPPN